MTAVFGEVTVDIDDFVATVEFHRPPNNHFDIGLIRSLADAIEELDKDDSCRAVILCSEGKHFCAGAELASRLETQKTGGTVESVGHLYDEAIRLFSGKTPIVAAVQGVAIGSGLGLAMAADFRVASPRRGFLPTSPGSASIMGLA